MFFSLRLGSLIVAIAFFLSCTKNKKAAPEKRQVNGANQSINTERDHQNQSFTPPSVEKPSRYVPPRPKRFSHVPLRENGIIQYKKYEKTKLDPSDRDAWINSFKETEEFKQGNWKFLYIPDVFLGSQEDLNWARIGLSKSINMVAPQAKKIFSPLDISKGYGLVYAINITNYWGDRADHKWSTVANSRFTRGFSRAPKYRLESFDESKAVAADRFAYNAMHSWNYNELIDHPYNRRPGGGGPSIRGSLGGLFDRLRGQGGNEQTIPSNPVSSQGLAMYAPGEVTHRFAVRNAITYGPRFVQRRQLTKWRGSLYESFDDFNGTVRELPWENGQRVHPARYGNGMMKQFGTTTSEAWAHMPNGLPAFFLFGNGSQERSSAEYSTVVDPLNVYGSRDGQRKTKHGKLINGFCTFCHYQGVQKAHNDMFALIQNGHFKDDPEKEVAAKAYWTSDEKLNELYAEDAKIFQEALADIVYGIGGGDPQWLHKVVNGAIEKEPVYYLVSNIMGLNKKGLIEGNRLGNAPGVGFEDRFRGDYRFENQ